MPCPLLARPAIGYEDDRQGCGRATKMACYCVGGETARRWQLTACIRTMRCRPPEAAAKPVSISCDMYSSRSREGQILQYHDGNCLQPKSLVCFCAVSGSSKGPPEAAPQRSGQVRSANSSYLSLLTSHLLPPGDRVICTSVLAPSSPQEESAAARSARHFANT
jgi:hypothetical protein